ncbi:SGNH/GDSL hydrolase family protein [Pseudoneobacillus rhizosphaerae]|uniref:SGNH hydrolase-type esterase domain-containing protein n=1 Tax=Pseudoneobacillus rhizosphaerae TaxID=2880968 RepID=A0A9C7LAN2_9BACI|nr:GDSL-type esterase/lipase family protein [Pseudoneobacillus rhizosphaerae]CAG9608058.1 hypothetical protein NEOCIP111885_01750 [Pseudoneobacillus rhizosphaerae]
MQTINKQTITIDLKRSTVIPLLRFIQGDTNQLEIVINDNGQVADFSNIGRIVTNFKRKDRKVISRLLTNHSNNKVLYQFGLEENQVAGESEIELQFFSIDNKERISTHRFKILLFASIGTDEIHENNGDLPLLQKLFVEVEELISDTDSASQHAQTQGDYAKTQGDYVAAKKPDIDKFTSEQSNLQKQLDVLVIDGDSSPESAQARVNKSGTVYATLKARLDDENTKINTSLAEKAKQSDLVTTNATVSANTLALSSKAEKSDLDSKNTATNQRIDNLIVVSGNANAEVTDAHTSAIKNKTYSVLKTRLDEIETDTYLLAKNQIINGNFNDNSNWYIPYSTNSVTNNELTVVKSSSSTTARIEQQGFASIAGNKYYVRGDIFPKYATTTYITLDNTTKVNKTVVVNQWNTVSGITTPTVTGTFQFVHSNVGYTAGESVKFRRVLVVNLTAMFGAGNEPSLSEFETFLANFTNSWFDATVQFINPSQMFKRLTQKLDASVAITNASQLPITDSGNYYVGSNVESALQEIGANAYFLAANKVINGDFSNGNTEWYIPSGSNSVANNVLTYTVTSKNSTARIEQLSFVPTVGRKYYVRGDLFPKYATATSFQLGGAVAGLTVTANQWNKLSAILTPIDTTDFQFIHSTAVSYVAGDSFQYQNIMVVDLTATFGEGNEPNISQFEELLSRFTNNWFNGTVSLLTPKQLYALIMKTSNPNVRFKGKTLVCFGDSITAGYPAPRDYTYIIANDILGLNVINMGFGGCQMGVHDDVRYDPYSMYQLANSIATNNFTLQDSQLSSGVPNYFATRIATLKTIDWTKVDYITIAYGTNDGGKLVDNANNLLDVNTFNGATRYSLDKLLTAHPHLKVILMPVIYRWYADGTDSDNNKRGVNQIVLTDYVKGIGDVGKEFKIPVADTYYGLGMNKYNKLVYFNADDGTHPNEKGMELIGHKVADTLKSVY